jgi:ligand-binding sensor domain-containing protein
MAALVVVVWFVLSSPPPTAQSSPATPSVVESAPATPAAAATPERQETAPATPAAPEEEIPRGGFAFRPPSGFNLTKTDVSATLTGPTTNGALAPVLLLSGGTPAQFVGADRVPDPPELGAILDSFVTYFSQEDDFDAGEPVPLTVDGAPALAVDLLSRNETNRFAGRIVMAQPAPDTLFVMVGVAPEKQWRTETEAAYQQTLDSVRLLTAAVATNATPPASVTDTATATPALAATGPAITEEVGKAAPASPAATPAPSTTQSPAMPTRLAPTATEAPLTPLPTAQPTPTAIPAGAALPTPSAEEAANLKQLILSNANIVNRVTLSNDNLWAATEGGVAVWSQENDGFVKFTPLDGLASNQFTAVVNCPLPGLGVVFGGDSGLQIFDTRTGRWNALNTGNSAMSFDDVSALFCDVENGFLIIGYQRHGLDIFDVTANTWTHLDRNNGLGADIVNDVTVIGDRERIWVSSGAGLSVLENGGPPDGKAQLYNAANSPLELAQLTGLAADKNGAVWIAGGRKLYRVDGDEWTIYDATDLSGGDLPFPSAPLAGLDVAADGSVWLADANAVVCRFDPVTERCREVYRREPGMAVGPVASLFAGETDAGDEWVYYATAGRGVSRFDGAGWRAYTAPGELLLGNQIRSLALDKEGFIWVATEHGAQQFSPSNPGVMRLYPAGSDKLPLTDVRAIAAGSVRGLWLGGDDGLAYLDEGQWTRYTSADGLPDDRVQALASDRQRRTWIGTRNGLSIWNGESFFNLTRENGLPSDNITALLAADDRSVWIGTSNGGLYQYANNQLRVYAMDNAGLLSDTVTALAQAGDGSILVGSELGLARFTDNVAKRVEGAPAVAVASLVARGDEIWMGTQGDGLYHFDGQSWTRQSGLPSSTVSALLLDQFGALWVGGDGGGVMRK